MMFRPVNETRLCNNPCNNGGTCKYVDATDGYICVCTPNYCGNNCEFVRPCQKATCAYDNATKASAWESEGCVDVLPDTTTDGVTEDTGPEKAGLVGLIILLLVLLVGLLTAATVGFVIYRRKKTPEVEEDEEEQVEDVGDGMFSFFGW